MKFISLLILLVSISWACSVSVANPTAIPTVGISATSYSTPQPVVQTPKMIREVSAYLVTSDELEVREGPGEQYHNVGKWLPKGTQVRLYYCRDDGWCRIDGGFVFSKFIKVVR